eukprot:scaffold1219_cov400-Prasinococcus_capsulatus_cf.AAC.30
MPFDYVLRMAVLYFVVVVQTACDRILLRSRQCISGQLLHDFEYSVSPDALRPAFAIGKLTLGRRRSWKSPGKFTELTRLADSCIGATKLVLLHAGAFPGCAQWRLAYLGWEEEPSGIAIGEQSAACPPTEPGPPEHRRGCCLSPQQGYGHAAQHSKKGREYWYITSSVTKTAGFGELKVHRTGAGVRVVGAHHNLLPFLKFHYSVPGGPWQVRARRCSWARRITGSATGV